MQRETLHRAAPRMFGERLMVKTPGQGNLCKVFNCEASAPHKDGTILEIERRDPNVLPEIEVFREGECNVEELALQLAREERSFLLRGAPGTGKSHLLKRVLKLVNNPVVCARTHVAASQFEAGITLSRFKHRMQKGYFKGALCLDEVWMVENTLLDVVSKISLNNHFMIFAGDDAQLPPIKDTHHGQSVPALWDSDFLKDLAPICLELTVCKRSDARLHNFGLLCREGQLTDCLEQARALFHAEGEPEVSLTVTNARRQQINEEVNRRLAPEESRLLESEDGPILLYEGAPLIGVKTQSGVTNAIWYTVAETSEQLHLISERKEEVVLSYEQAAKVLALRHAMTIHKSQSRTLEGRVHICPGSEPGAVSPYLTLQHLLVAASRATSIENLSIE